MSASVKSILHAMSVLDAEFRVRLYPTPIEADERAHIEHPCETCGMREAEHEIQAVRRVMNVCSSCAHDE